MATFTKQYNPNRSADWNYGGPKWKLSRSKIDLFLECPRCFYLDNKLGTGRPRGPAFNLNIAVDTLFKKEFDACRKEGVPHPIMEEGGLDAVPFAHEQMDTWRENFEGIQHVHKETGLTISGAVDDIWVTSTGELIVVDYKSTSKEGRIESLADSSWEDQYKRQMGVYQWLLTHLGFKVSKTGYFVYANASTAEEAFNDTLLFETTLIPCEGDTSWIDPTILKIKTCLDSSELPDIGTSCEYCAYREAAGKKLLAVYNATKQK